MKRRPVFGWCWSKYFQDYAYRFLYWFPAQVKKLRTQLLDNKPVKILAGFMSRHRGRHWRRT